MLEHFGPFLNTFETLAGRIGTRWDRFTDSEHSGPIQNTLETRVEHFGTQWELFWGALKCFGTVLNTFETRADQLGTFQNVSDHF